MSGVGAGGQHAARRKGQFYSSIPFFALSHYG
jgi:hypothetical protein